MVSSEIVAAAGGKPFLASESLPSIRAIKGIDEADWDIIERLLRVWLQKQNGNILRSLYYSAHERVKDFGISIPDKIRSNVSVMIGWPAKAVRMLADLSAFEGFSVDGGSDEGLAADVSGVFESNALDTVVSQAVVSAYTHSCAFLTISRTIGGVTIIPRSADWSAAIWDSVNNRIGYALTITDADEHGVITGFNVWLPNRVYVCSNSMGKWSAERQDTNYGRPTVVSLCYDPQLNRPFGRSRITRPLMSLTDIGVRTMLRMEANAEFYAAPKLWFLGADRDAFSENTWKSLISAINAISKDEDGDVPTLQQVQQASMQPHSDMLKTIAMLVASETNVPVNDLGITMDNPASAEAMAAAERKLSREADRQNRLFSRALKDAVGMALDLDSTELARITPVWAPTREVSDAARADSFSKIAGVQPAFAESEVGWRYAGFPQSDVTQIMNAVNANKAGSVLDRLVNGGVDGTQQQPNAQPQPSGQTQPSEPVGGGPGSERA